MELKPRWRNHNHSTVSHALLLMPRNYNHSTVSHALLLMPRNYNHSTAKPFLFSWSLKVILNEDRVFFTWRHGGHIGVPKQWTAAMLPRKSSGSWTLFSCKHFLLFQDAGHVPWMKILTYGYKTLLISHYYPILNKDRIFWDGFLKNCKIRGACFLRLKLCREFSLKRLEAFQNEVWKWKRCIFVIALGR